MSVTKLYDRLAPHERVRLCLAARAREDEIELARLQRTTPCKNYTMADAAALEPWLASRTIAHTWALLWARAYSSWIAAEALVLCATKDGPLEALPTPEEEAAEMACFLRACTLAGLYAGLERFCVEAELDPEMLIGAWLGPSVLEEVEGPWGQMQFVSTMHGKVSNCCSLGCDLLSQRADETYAMLCRLWPATRGDAR